MHGCIWKSFGTIESRKEICRAFMNSIPIVDTNHISRWLGFPNTWLTLGNYCQTFTWASSLRSCICSYVISTHNNRYWSVSRYIEKKAPRETRTSQDLQKMTLLSTFSSSLATAIIFALLSTVFRVMVVWWGVFSFACQAILTLQQVADDISTRMKDGITSTELVRTLYLAPCKKFAI